MRLHEAFGYGPVELAGFSLAAARHSFLPPAEKEALAARLSAEIAAAAERHLGRALAIRGVPYFL
jgi:hypothetical protein